MSLQGMLETIPLPDVLALLSATKKSGELRVTGSRGDGRLWLSDGAVVGADVPRAATPVDAVFELLRLTSGNFAFESGSTAPEPGAPIAVDVLLSEAQKRLGEWRAIEAVVPSMGCTVSLAPELEAESVTISRRQWKDLVAVVTAGDVSGVARRLSVGEYEACRSVKDLADAGLVAVGAAPKAAPVPPPAAAKAEAVPETPTLQQGPSDRRAAPPVAVDTGGHRPAAAEPPAPGLPGSERPAAPSAERSAPQRPAPQRPAPERPAPERPAPQRPTAERTPAAPPRPAAVPSRPAPVPGPAGRRGAPVPSAEEADELVQQLASLGRRDPGDPAPAAQAASTAGRSETRTAPLAGRPAHATRGRIEPGSAPAAPPAAEEAQTDADSTPPADAASDEPINRGMLLKFLSSVRP